MNKILVITLFLTSFINSVEAELAELEIKDELYQGNTLAKAESNTYSFIGVREDKDTIIIAAQKRNPYSLRGYNFTQCVIHTKKDKLCYYVDYTAGKQRLNIFRLDEPHPKAFALMLLFISITAKRSDRTTKRFPKIPLETED